MPDYSGLFAVITADVVQSRLIPAGVLDARLKVIAHEIETHALKRKKAFEIYRGDSFQAIVDPKDALMIALLWRAAMKATPGANEWDIRVAVGLGEINHRGETLAVSGGEAFQQSGELLDQLKHNLNQRIAFHTSDEFWTSTLNTECLLCEGLIERWTIAGAQTIYSSMLFGDTQEGLAERMGVSQPAIHKRLQVASWPAIRHWEQHYRSSVARSKSLNKKSKE